MPKFLTAPTTKYLVECKRQYMKALALGAIQVCTSNLACLNLVYFKASLGQNISVCVGKSLLFEVKLIRS